MMGRTDWISTLFFGWSQVTEWFALLRFHCGVCVDKSADTQAYFQIRWYISGHFPLLCNEPNFHFSIIYPSVTRAWFLAVCFPDWTVAINVALNLRGMPRTPINRSTLWILQAWLLLMHPVMSCGHPEDRPIASCQVDGFTLLRSKLRAIHNLTFRPPLTLKRNV